MSVFPLIIPDAQWLRSMPLSTQSQSGNEDYVLVASLDNVRNLSNILKAISFKDHAIFNATQNGLKVTVEESKCLQANAFIQVGVLWTSLENIVISHPLVCALESVFISVGGDISRIHLEGGCGWVSGEPHGAAGLPYHLWRKHSARHVFKSSQVALLSS